MIKWWGRKYPNEMEEEIKKEIEREVENILNHAEKVLGKTWVKFEFEHYTRHTYNFVYTIHANGKTYHYNRTRSYSVWNES